MTIAKTYPQSLASLVDRLPNQAADHTRGPYHEQEPVLLAKPVAGLERPDDVVANCWRTTAPLPAIVNAVLCTRFCDPGAQVSCVLALDLRRQVALSV